MACRRQMKDLGSPLLVHQLQVGNSRLANVEKLSHYKKNVS